MRKLISKRKYKAMWNYHIKNISATTHKTIEISFFMQSFYDLVYPRTREYFESGRVQNEW